MRKNKNMFDDGYLPKLESKSYNTFFKLGRYEVFLGWNSTFIKLKYIKHVILPWFETEAARYGRDVHIGWLGGMIEISYTNNCLLYTSPSPRDRTRSRMPSSA